MGHVINGVRFAYFVRDHQALVANTKGQCLTQVFSGN